jgi:hypothetical protein
MARSHSPLVMAQFRATGPARSASGGPRFSGTMRYPEAGRYSKILPAGTDWSPDALLDNLRQVPTWLGGADGVS